MINTRECGIANLANRHIHLRDGIIFEISVVVVVENFVIIEGHSFRSQHFREHLELLMAETLILSLLFSPVVLLRTQT